MAPACLAGSPPGPGSGAWRRPFLRKQAPAGVSLPPTGQRSFPFLKLAKNKIPQRGILASLKWTIKIKLLSLKQGSHGRGLRWKENLWNRLGFVGRGCLALMERAHPPTPHC